jgi:hypothetical protein
MISVRIKSPIVVPNIIDDDHYLVVENVKNNLEERCIQYLED